MSAKPEEVEELVRTLEAEGFDVVGVQVRSVEDGTVTVDDLRALLERETEAYNRMLHVAVAAIIRINEIKGVPLNDPVVFTYEDLTATEQGDLGIRGRMLDTGDGVSFQVQTKQEAADASSN